MAEFRGRTEEAEAPFLKASFWQKGKSISGKVIRVFTMRGQEDRLTYSLQLVKPVEVDGESADRVSIGSAGFHMAVQAAGVPKGELIVGDQIHVECTGTSETDKGNDRTNFSIEVNRPDRAAARA